MNLSFCIHCIIFPAVTPIIAGRGATTPLHPPSGAIAHRTGAGGGADGQADGSGITGHQQQGINNLFPNNERSEEGFLIGVERTGTFTLPKACVGEPVCVLENPWTLNMSKFNQIMSNHVKIFSNHVKSCQIMTKSCQIISNHVKSCQNHVKSCQLMSTNIKKLAGGLPPPCTPLKGLSPVVHGRAFNGRAAHGRAGR